MGLRLCCTKPTYPLNPLFSPLHPVIIFKDILPDAGFSFCSAIKPITCDWSYCHLFAQCPLSSSSFNFKMSYAIFINASQAFASAISTSPTFFSLGTSPIMSHDPVSQPFRFPPVVAVKYCMGRFPYYFLVGHKARMTRQQLCGVIVQMPMFAPVPLLFFCTGLRPWYSATPAANLVGWCSI